MPTNHPPPQGPPPRPVEVAHTEHHEDSFSTAQITGFVVIVILIPLILWGLKLAITRTLTQSDKEKKEVNDRLDALETTKADHEVALAKRPTFENLSHAKQELRDEFRGKQ